jgi:hypothetical protein
MLCKKPRYKTKKIFIPQPKHTTVQKETDENDNKENILLINENSKNQFNENEISNTNNISKNSFTVRNSLKVYFFYIFRLILKFILKNILLVLNFLVIEIQLI